MLCKLYQMFFEGPSVTHIFLEGKFQNKIKHKGSHVSIISNISAIWRIKELYINHYISGKICVNLCLLIFSTSHAVSYLK